MSDTMPVPMLKTQAAKDEVANYRRMGLRDDELGFVMDGDAELVVTNKAGLIKLMKAAPIGADPDDYRTLTRPRDGENAAGLWAGDFPGCDAWEPRRMRKRKGKAKNRRE